MSATNRGGIRRADDEYITPAWCVRRLLDAWTPPEKGAFVEPAVGDGAIIRAMPKGILWLAHDIRDVKPVAEVHRQGDFLEAGPDSYWVTAVVTNPPFCLAEEFIRHARKLHPCADLVFLLRLCFLASVKRLALWHDVGTPDVHVLPNRPSFTGSGTDSTDYAWFVWPREKRDYARLTVLPETPADERRPGWLSVGDQLPEERESP